MSRSSNPLTKRTLASLLGAALLLSAAGCSQSASSSSQASNPAPSSASGESAAQPQSEPLVFSMLCNYNSVEPPKAEKMLEYFQEHLNTTVNFTWIPTTAYNDKINAQIAAADLPNVCAVREAKGSSIVSAVRSGMFWQLDDYINSDYPSFDRLNKGILETLKIDGKLYSIPRERDIARAGIYYRADWLENVGLSSPTNMEEIYEVIKAFTEMDPDGNGIADTTGITMKGKNLRSFLTNVSIYYGGPREWYLAEDGAIHNEVDAPQYKMALDFFRDAYANGYMLSDFTVNTDETIPFKSGKAGLCFANTIGDAVNVEKDLQQLYPDAYVDITQEIHTPEGNVALRAHAGYTGVLMFPKTKTKTVEELLPILRFFDELGYDENVMYLKHGVEGVHYTIEDGYVVTTPEQLALYTKDFADPDDVNQLHPYSLINPVPEKPADNLKQRVTDSMNAHINDVVFNVADAYISETSVTLGNTLTDILTDACMKYVIGELDETGWYAAVAEWKAAGGDQVAQEYTDAYNSAHA